jgi:hypothetical protein
MFVFRLDGPYSQICLYQISILTAYILNHVPLRESQLLTLRKTTILLFGMEIQQKI